MELGLKNSRVLVTGSTRGIGLATAQAFLDECARVVLTSRSGKEQGGPAALLTAKHGPGRVLRSSCDFRVREDITALKELIVSSWGGLDILVANVGYGGSVPDPVPEKGHFQDVIDENLYTGIDTAREFLPLITASQGSVVFVASIAGVEAFGAPVDYSVAKTALIAFSKNLARKVSDGGVRVNCVAPGNVFFEGGSWDMKMKEDPERIKAIIESTVPMKRFGTPREIADAILFLSSARASFITGACLIIDGGQTVTLF